MKKLRHIIIATAIALVASPLFSYAATQPASSTPAEGRIICNLETSLDKLVAIRDQENKDGAEFDIYNEVLTNILGCSLSEIASLKDRLDAIENLSEADTEIRDGFLRDLMGFTLYHEEIADRLKEMKTVEDQKQFAAELLNWRKENYSEKAETIANFIFIFRGKELIETAEARLKKISLALLDTGLLFRKENWTDFNTLLSEAKAHIVGAQKINVEAYEALRDKLNPEKSANPAMENGDEKDITALLRESLLEIRESYVKFGEIGKLVTKTSSN